MKLYCKINRYEIDDRRTVIYENILTIGKFYEGEKMKKPNTQDSYIISCDDNKNRLIDADLFMTLTEFRNEQLNKLGI